MNTFKNFFTICLLAATLMLAHRATAQDMYEYTYFVFNGFDLTNITIPITDVVEAGPHRDGIPSLMRPSFEASTCGTEFVKDKDQVIGIVHNGVAKAYPVKIVAYHEIVNDDFDGQRLIITHSPLTGSTLVFGPDKSNHPAFGVSGMLYNNNTIMYDRGTESLWCQLTGEAIAGPLTGQRMPQIKSSLTSWGAWKAKHPDTKVLSTDTGHQREYDKMPYEKYASTDEIYYPLTASNSMLPAKERVLAIEVNGAYKAYPYSLLMSGKKMYTEDVFNGQKVQIQFHKDGYWAEATDGAGNLLTTTTAYWFSWYAFHPESEVFGFLPEERPFAAR